jgi:RNA polymerase sigma-70 factor (ECF subfamily)
MRERSIHLQETRTRGPPNHTPLRQLYQSEASYVHWSLRRLGVPPVDVEDLSQEVFLRAFSHAERYDDTRPARPWLFGIAYRVVSESKRRRRRRGHEVEISEENEPSGDSPDPEQSAQARQSRAIVLEVLQRMSLKQRAVLVMHEIDGERLPDIAETLHLPLNTVYSRIRLARKQFAKILHSLEDRTEGQRSRTA